MDYYKLGAIETRFAELIWDNEPMTTRQLVDLCAQDLSWKRTTTYSVLKKLTEKGFFQVAEKNITSLITKDAYNAIQSEKFIEDTFSGSLPALLVSFGSRKKLSQAEIEELHRIVDGMRG